MNDSSTIDSGSPKTPGTNRAAASIRDQRRQFASGQHIISDGNFFRLKREPHSFVDAFVVATENDESTRIGRQIFRIGLRERTTRAVKETATELPSPRCFILLDGSVPPHARSAQPS